jgi:hypothetical protein
VRVVPVVRLIAFRFPGAGLVNHDDGTSWWSEPLQCSIVVVAAARDRARGLVPVVRERPLRRAVWSARLPGQAGYQLAGSLEKSRTDVTSSRFAAGSEPM